MQAEFDVSHPGQIDLLAVNGAAFGGGMATMSALGDLPVLQDTVTDDVWNTWAVTYRDVVVLDADNQVVGVYNLTANNLNVQANYDALKAMLEGAVAP